MGAGEAGVIITLELSGTLGLLGSPLLGCLRGEGACTQ